PASPDAVRRNSPEPIRPSSPKPAADSPNAVFFSAILAPTLPPSQLPTAPPNPPPRTGRVADLRLTVPVPCSSSSSPSVRLRANGPSAPAAGRQRSWPRPPGGIAAMPGNLKHDAFSVYELYNPPVFFRTLR